MRNILFILLLIVIPINGYCGAGIMGVIANQSTQTSPTISYNSFETGTNTGSGCIINVPANTVDGDLMLISLNNDDVGSFTTTDWVLIQQSPYSSARIGSYYRIASSEPASYNFGTSVECSGIITLYKKTSGTWVIRNSAVGIAPPNAPSVGPVTASEGDMLVFTWGSDDPETVITPPVDMLPTVGILVEPSSSRVGAWYQENVTAGDYTKSITATNESAAILVAIGVN